MIKGDKIEVTFHNVMVQKSDAKEPENASLTVTDSIPNSEATYASKTMIAVHPPTAGDVSILSGKTVPAEGTVDLKVRYAATEVLAGKDGDDTYSGRIRVELPTGWTHQSADSEIFTERPVGKPDATYLSLVGSSSAVLSAKPVLSVSASSPHVIDIDVSQMRNRQYVTLTIHNLMIAKLSEARTIDRHADVTNQTNLVQVKVFSGRYESSALRDGSDPTRAPATIHKDFRISSATAGGSDTQPTITVNRKTLGEVDITPAKVPAGSVTNFKIAYKLTEDMDDNDVIEINLPPYLATSPTSWTAPSISVRKPKSPPKTSHVYLSGTVTRLEPTIRVIDGGDVEAVDGDTTPAKGWIVQIALGSGKTMSKGGTITLHYDRAVVQRALATNDPAKTVEPKKLVIKTFSGDESVNGVPQYPAAEMIKDTIEVTVAADGSGMVMFEHDGNDVTTMKGTMKSQEDGEEDTEEDTYVTFVSNTDVSIPAGLDADDLRQLVVEYVPAGNMGTAGEFEVRLPSGWSAVDSLVSGGEKDSDKSHPTNSDDTVVVDLYDNFGETSTDRVYITFTDITVPNKHGEVEFTAKSKSGGTRAQLESRATAFIGNAEAMYDTVGVKITPDAAYENEERVNFVIELTNTGPLHDSEIQITVPEGLSGLSNDPKNASNDNFVKMVSTTARSVRLSTLDIIDEDIIVKTGKLNAAGKIVIHFNNVDIGDITETDDANGENADTGFRVYTRTRVPNAVAEEDQDFASFEDPIEVAYERIQKADGKRGIMGGLIRIVNGSGSLAVKPRVVEQNSQNQTITLTYTAATDIKEKDLVIQLPSVIETIGGVSPARKETSGRTLTWEKRTISEGHSFIVTITGVDFLGYTGDFRWITTLGGTQLLDTDNPPMVVVGTTKTDVAFEIVENGGVAFLDPSYPAASEQSIRFQFTAENTAIQPGGKLRFKVPGGGWTAPSITDRAG